MRTARTAAAVVFGLAAVAGAQQASVNVIDDRPDAAACSVPFGLPPGAPDLNNQPQAEVWIDVAEDGRLAAAAKDYRFSPTDDTTYNNRVWNGLYLSDDGGASWRNLAFEDATPDTGVSGVTDGAYGRAAGTRLSLTHETDPVVAFDRDGNLYTCGLALEPGAAGDPSAIVVSRRGRDGGLAAGATHLIGLENDAALFNDKNWLAVDRESPREGTVVVASWRLFTVGTEALAPEGGWIAVSGDGASSFSAPIRLPVPAEEASQSQFYQPLLGRDPASGRRVLYVVLRTQDRASSLAMHVVKADIEGAAGTPGLEARLRDPSSWSFLPARVSGLFGFGASGYDGGFRFGSSFMPALDPDSGHLFAVVHAFDLATGRSRALVTRSGDGGLSWSPPKPIDDPGRGNQLMPAVAARGGRVHAVWYDSRNDPAFGALAPIQALDVYAALLDDGLRVQSVSRLTPEAQRADRPAFTRPRGAATASREGERPHDYDPGREGPGARAFATLDCVSERYGFIGDYIGIGASPAGAWAAWTDLRDVRGPGDVCAGHACSGNRNQNIHALRLPW